MTQRFITLFLFFALTASISAQGRGRQMPSAKEQLDMLSKELTLTKAQEAKILPIFEKSEKKLKKQIAETRAQFQANNFDRSQMAEMRKEMEKANDKKIKEIEVHLTAEQKKKYAKLRKRRKIEQEERRNARRGGGGGRN